MKKQLKKKTVYEDDDFDYSDYLPPNYSTPFPATRGPSQPQQYQPEEQEEEKSTTKQTKVLFCLSYKNVK